MIKLNKLITTLAAISLLAGGSFVMANGQENSQSLSAYISGDAIINQDGNNTAEGLAGLELQMTESFRANLAVQLKHLADEAQAGDLSDAEWEKIISEANITLDLSLGQVVAEVQFGKRDRSPRLQQVLSSLQRASDTSLMPHDDRGIIGVWVTVPTETLGELNFSITETEGGDFSFNDDQVRMTASMRKALTDSLTVVGSVGFENNSTGDNGYAVSGGVQYDVTDDLSAYGSITHYDNYSGIFGSETGWEVGLDYDWTENTTVGGSYESFNDEDKLYVGVDHTLRNGMIASGGVFVRNVGQSNQSEGLEAMLRIPIQKGRIR